MTTLVSVEALTRANHKFRKPPAPKGNGIVGKVGVAPRIPVNRALHWDHAANAAAPHAPKESRIWNLENTYPRNKTARTPEYHNVVLVNFGKFCANKGIFSWSKGQRLVPVHPRVLLAFGVQYPEFGKEMRGKTLITTLQPFRFGEYLHVCVLSHEDGYREACLLPYEGGWNDKTWFAFEYQ